MEENTKRSTDEIIREIKCKTVKLNTTRAIANKFSSEVYMYYFAIHNGWKWDLPRKFVRTVDGGVSNGHPVIKNIYIEYETLVNGSIGGMKKIINEIEELLTLISGKDLDNPDLLRTRKFIQESLEFVEEHEEIMEYIKNNWNFIVDRTNSDDSGLKGDGNSEDAIL